MPDKIVFTELQEDLMVGYYLEGKTAREIAPIFGVSDPLILRVLHKHGVEIDKKRGADYHAKKKAQCA
jgi:hypothetical protein